MKYLVSVKEVNYGAVEVEAGAKAPFYFGGGETNVEAFGGMPRMYVDGEPSNLRIDELVQVMIVEAKYGIHVYTIIYNERRYGICMSMLYLTDDESLDEEDEADLIDGMAMTYTLNLDHPELSEFGAIGIRNFRRTW